VLRAARTLGHAPVAERAVAAFSSAGEHGAIWVVPGLLAGGRWRRAAGTVALSYVVNQLIKLAVPRRRPRLDGLPPLVDTHSDRSFPSAHSTTSFAGARAYSRRGLPALPLYAVAVAFATSRVWLGVHHPSDVLAGAALGTVIAR
jgi:undecaprenyl-diphosphatase